MRLILVLFVLLLVALPAALVAAVFLAFQDQPLLRREADLTPEHIERAKRVLQQNDPRKARDGTLRSVTILGEDLDLAANYVANQYGRGSSRILLQPGALTLVASIEVPQSPIGRYLNVEAGLRETGGLPEVDELRIGSLPVPAWLANFALEQAMRALERGEGGAGDALKRVAIADGALRVVYEWRADLPERLRKALLPQADRERLQAYQQRLVEVADGAAATGGLSLLELVMPLAKLAVERAGGRDPRAENRALIAVLAFYVNGKGLTAIVPEAKDWPRPAPRKVTLAGRHDFAQHFSISAAISAYAGSPLSDAIGLYKEVDDSRGGTGFSFNDIAADRAGTLFGERAARSEDGARLLLKRIAAGIAEPDMMPEAADLPEFMKEAEFNRLFAGVGSPKYKEMMQEIERRVAACALYH